LPNAIADNWGEAFVDSCVVTSLGIVGDVGGDIGGRTSEGEFSGPGAMNNDFRFCSIGFCSVGFSGVTGGEIGNFDRFAFLELRCAPCSNSIEGEAPRLARTSDLSAMEGAERLRCVELPSAEGVPFEFFESCGHEWRCFNNGGVDMTICGATTL
jgi:hypothetical protein